MSARPSQSIRRLTRSIALASFLLSVRAGFAQATAPDLTAFSLAGSAAVDGATTPSVTFDFSITAGTYPIDFVAVYVNDPNGFQMPATLYTSGTATFTPFRSIWINGTYTVNDVAVVDLAPGPSTDETDYISSGSITVQGTETLASTSDPAAPPVTFTVTGGADAVGPTLNSISIVSNSLNPRRRHFVRRQHHTRNVLAAHRGRCSCPGSDRRPGAPRGLHAHPQSVRGHDRDDAH